MKKLLILLLILPLMAAPARALDYTAPTPPPEAQALMPQTQERFGEGLLEVLKAVLPEIQPAVAEAAGICLALMAAALITSLAGTIPGCPKQTVGLAGALAVGTLLLRPSGALIRLGSQTVKEMSEYGKLLLPVMTAALAAQGGGTASAALYTGTAVFDAVLGALISKVTVPMLYLFLCLGVANSAVGEDMLKKLRDFLKWLMTWSLKLVLYIFTGYMGITKVVSGTADAAAVKAAKLTISGMVPVVGGLLSDASETILVSAGVMRSAAGVYGLLAILAICLGPFLRIGVQYLMLKLTAAACAVFGTKETAGLIQDFSAGMGMLLAMTGTMCLLLLISTVCFLKGVE